MGVNQQEIFDVVPAIFAANPHPEPKSLPLLHRMEERVGERRDVVEDAPLLGPLPAPASRGEEEKARSKNLREKATDRDQSAAQKNVSGICPPA